MFVSSCVFAQDTIYDNALWMGGGIAYHATEHSRLRMQYIWEEARFRTPQQRTNIIWLRYEMVMGG